MIVYVPHFMIGENQTKSNCCHVLYPETTAHLPVSIFLSVSSGLSNLHCLNKLSLDGNQISGLDASVLDQLPNLSFLSVENNCISSLQGIQRLRSLLELYIGNNEISTSRDIYYLKARV